VILEHQSTVNPNMPLRLLSYIARVYEKITSGKKTRLYGKKGFRVPRPEFIVLYNGVDPFPEEKTIRLSDSFEDIASLGLPAGPDLELTARVYNINEGHNQAMVQRNETLSGYVMFTAKVREYESGLLGGKRPADITKDERKRIIKTAITKAVQWCIGNNVLRGFFEENGSEVINMLFDEWKLEDALVVEREEGREEGREAGREEGREERDAEIAKNALREGLPLEFIQKITGLSTETIQNLTDR
jgi:hypothetical protein